MQFPALPPDEADRLWQLRALELLDTPDEERFDRITRLARQLFDVPIALITLVDEDRQWFKSCQGLEVRQTIREFSFCGHAILGESPLLIPDARRDSRFHDNPLVTGSPHIRFYAGYPLHTPEGHRVGTLCIIDRHPRNLTEAEVASLKDLAGIAERELVANLLAQRNTVTGLANQLGFSTLAQQSLNLCARHSQGASLLLIELSGVTAINSRFGAQGVGQALQHFVTHVRQTLRGSDLVGHPTGSEFLVLLPATSSTSASRVVGRLRSRLASQTRGGRHRYQLAFDAGVLDWEPGQPIEVLLRQVAQLKAQQHQGPGGGNSSASL